ncbi:MAG: DUF4279 domain-containing protein [Christensenellales bacterium]
MSNHCTIYAEMHMIFDNDFDVYSITKRLGIVPAECKTRSETRISPLTNKHIEGFWTLKTEETEEWDLGVVLNELMGKISAKLPDIKKICDENGGTVVFDIVPFFDGNTEPTLYFERDFLNIVDYLNATIQIDLYVG